MSSSNTNTKSTGKLEGTIRIDTGKDEILNELNQLEAKLKKLAEETSDQNQQTRDSIEQVAKDTAKILKELREETLNKLREQESILSTIRKTIAELDSRQEEQIQKQRELRKTTEKLQGDLIFEERILPGVKELIRTRDDVIGQLNNSEETEDNYIFYEALDSSLEKVLKEFDVKEIKPDNGDKFDPEVQEVVGEKSTLQSKDDGKVVEVLKPGYRWEDRLIRPQKVKVTKFQGGSK